MAKAMTIVEKIRKMEVAGRDVKLRATLSCISCGRAAGALARILYPGGPVCTKVTCEYLYASDVTECFETEYGRAVDLYTLRMFCRCIDEKSTFVERNAIIARSQEMQDGHADLVLWQQAYTSFSMVFHTEAHRLGKTVVVPPRRIEEVLRIRLNGPWERLDPTNGLPAEMKRQITRIRESGPEPVEVPF